MSSIARRRLAPPRISPRNCLGTVTAPGEGRSRGATSDVEQPTRIAARAVATRNCTRI